MRLYLRSGARRVRCVSRRRMTCWRTRAADAVDTPEEALDHAAAQLRQALEADLLDRVRAAPSTFLERVVVDLLIAMGYGGGNAARGG